MTESRERGFVDQRKRPMILLRVAGPQTTEPIPTLVDTGFTGEVFVTASEFDRFPCQRTLWYEEVETAGGTVLALLVESTVIWIGAERDITLHVLLLTTIVRRGDPVASIGTGFLFGHTLTIDFSAESLIIE